MKTVLVLNPQYIFLLGMRVPKSKDLHLDWGKCERQAYFQHDPKTTQTTFPSR